MKRLHRCIALAMIFFFMLPAGALAQDPSSASIDLQATVQGEPRTVTVLSHTNDLPETITMVRDKAQQDFSPSHSIEVTNYQGRSDPWMLQVEAAPMSSGLDNLLALQDFTISGQCVAVYSCSLPLVMNEDSFLIDGIPRVVTVSDTYIGVYDFEATVGVHVSQFDNPGLYKTTITYTTVSMAP